jgi:hypothetical protein
MSTDVSEMYQVLLQVNPQNLPPLNSGNLDEYQQAYMAAVEGIADHIRNNCTDLVKVAESRSGVGEICVEGTAQNIHALLQDPVLQLHEGKIPEALWSTRREYE